MQHSFVNVANICPVPNFVLSGKQTRVWKNTATHLHYHFKTITFHFVRMNPHHISSVPFTVPPRKNYFQNKHAAVYLSICTNFHCWLVFDYYSKMRVTDKQHHNLLSTVWASKEEILAWGATAESSKHYPGKLQKIAPCCKYA